MAGYIDSLGWIIRFPPKGDTSVSDFYRNVLQLPFVRGFDVAHRVEFYWAGEAMIFELIIEGRTTSAPPLETDPATCSLIPSFRVHGLDELTDALRSRGAFVSSAQRYARGREAFVRDPLGGLIGLREADRESNLAHDVEARRRWRRGEAFNVGCDPMPAGWQELGWVVRHVADVPSMKHFYTDTMGLSVVAEEDGRVLLDLGDNSILELAPGGKITTPPTHRHELMSTFILRIRQLDRFREELQARGVHMVHEFIQWPAGALTYVADPEGHVIGIEERYHPSRYLSKTLPPFPEDLEALRRQKEQLADHHDAGPTAAEAIA